MRRTSILNEINGICWGSETYFFGGDAKKNNFMKMEQGCDQRNSRVMCSFSDGTCGLRCTHFDCIVSGLSGFLRMLRVNVSFPSGSGETLSLPEHSKVGDLKLLAQKTFRKGFLKLITVEGHVLTNLADSLQAAGVQDGEHLMAVAQQPQITATDLAFAVWCCGGNRVVTGGDPGCGGDCSAVQEKFQNVQQICATDSAFAAILADGSVTVWGSETFGGDISEVQDQLRHVQQIQASGGAFSVILADGSVVAWGAPDDGGDCSAVHDKLTTVQQIQATDSAFAAILADGSVVSWGDPNRVATAP